MNPDSARDDLAFIKALIAPDDHWQRQFGKLYAAAGACYSVQMLGHIGQLLNLVPGNEIVAQTIGWGPSVVFLILLFWVIRKDGPQRGGATSRAVGAVFAAVGLTNLALCASIGSVALRHQSLMIWLIYPCVVMILQGLAWLVAYMLRRRPWLGAVALGWFATGVAMAVLIDNMPGFVGAAAVGVVCFMLVPGLYIMRQADRGA
jgi:hypothetical protein